MSDDVCGVICFLHEGFPSVANSELIDPFRHLITTTPVQFLVALTLSLIENVVQSASLLLPKGSCNPCCLHRDLCRCRLYNIQYVYTVCYFINNSFSTPISPMLMTAWAILTSKTAVYKLSYRLLSEPCIFYNRPFPLKLSFFTVSMMVFSCDGFTERVLSCTGNYCLILCVHPGKRSGGGSFRTWECLYSRTPLVYL